MELIHRAPWHEAVTYQETWPHEYVVVKKDRQEELLAAICVRIAVWVAPEFLYEHAEALHRLNKWTREGLRFYGVKVMVLNTGNALGTSSLPSGDPRRLEQGHHTATGGGGSAQTAVPCLLPNNHR